MMRDEPFIRKILLRTEALDEGEFPLSVPAIAAAESIRFHRSVTFFTGENGSGKSTLLESIAVAAGFCSEGGTKNYRSSTDTTDEGLTDALTLVRGGYRESGGFFLRSETLYHLFFQVSGMDIAGMHNRSHGEAFMDIFTRRAKSDRDQLFILDELEAALSPQRQIEFLILMHTLVNRGCQFIIATHSPILMSYPHSRLYWFSDEGIEERDWKDTDHFAVYQAYINRSDVMLKALLD